MTAATFDRGQAIADAKRRFRELLDAKLDAVMVLARAYGDEHAPTEGAFDGRALADEAWAYGMAHVDDEVTA
jgi:hypothetical protein